MTAKAPTFITDDRVAWAYIKSMDFSLIRDKIRKSHPHWDDAFIAAAIRAYKQFMFVSRKAREQNMVVTPHLAVDEVWHEHVLCTRRYMADCNAILGGYMHHSPGEVGKPSDGDKQAFADTNRLIRRYFGQNEDPRVTLKHMPCGCDACMQVFYAGKVTASA
ncbi:MAG: glycine-rich domain-containing protein-like [Proteobacteria bacterium]|nr:glycine-rich domain-containing protein-like [Pseudomonadota bacterium]